ncbi:MAG: hypothetical protein ACI9HE_003469 [Planctomycetota bacterium]
MLDELTYSEKSLAHYDGEDLISCLGDYARFCVLFVGGQEFRRRRIVSEDGLV